MIWSNICIFFSNIKRKTTEQRKDSATILQLFHNYYFFSTSVFENSLDHSFAECPEYVLANIFEDVTVRLEWEKKNTKNYKCISRHPLHHFSYKHVKRLRSQFHFVLAHKAVSNWVRLHLTKFTNFLPERWCRMPRRNGDFPVERCRCIVWQALFWHLP